MHVDQIASNIWGAFSTINVAVELELGNSALRLAGVGQPVKPISFRRVLSIVFQNVPSRVDRLIDSQNILPGTIVVGG